MSLTLPNLDSVDLKGKTVLVRMDLNVPMQGGKITDKTRVVKLLPTLNELIEKKAKVVILSHFGRPEGKFVPSMSLAPLVDALSEVLGGKQVHFGVDCIGSPAKEAVAKLKAGEVLLLENLRFHAEEEDNNENFARELSSLGEIYVNDAFSCSHRAHASVSGIPNYLPSYAGRLLQVEVETLDSIFSDPKRPLAAIIGGSKVSTKLELLKNLVTKMDVLVIGGAMANTFLLAQGHKVGKSICEKHMKDIAIEILELAQKNECEVILPVDLIVTEKFEAQTPCRVVPVDKIPATHTATDIGPDSVVHFSNALKKCKMVVWNGPVGAFETSPFDASTVAIARVLAKLSTVDGAKTIAGGGDTLSAIAHAGMSENFTYLSTAGGAFLEWLEGKTLPGIAALLNTAMPLERKKKA